MGKLCIWLELEPAHIIANGTGVKSRMKTLEAFFNDAKNNVSRDILNVPNFGRTIDEISVCELCVWHRSRGQMFRVQGAC